MTVAAKDIEDLVSKIRYDLTAAQAKLSELKRALAEVPFPEDEQLWLCRVSPCGLSFTSERRRDEHEHNVHQTDWEAAPPPDFHSRRGSGGLDDRVEGRAGGSSAAGA